MQQQHTHLEENVHTTHRATTRSMSACKHTLTQEFHGAVSGGKKCMFTVGFCPITTDSFFLCPQSSFTCFNTTVFTPHADRANWNCGLSGNWIVKLWNKWLKSQNDILLKNTWYKSWYTHMFLQWSFKCVQQMLVTKIQHSLKVQYVRSGNSNHRR